MMTPNVALPTLGSTPAGKNSVHRDGNRLARALGTTLAEMFAE